MEFLMVHQQVKLKGISNRGCSIRIPLNVNKEGCRYLEDRRPSANLEPYLVVEKLMNCVM